MLATSRSTKAIPNSGSESVHSTTELVHSVELRHLNLAHDFSNHPASSAAVKQSFLSRIRDRLRGWLLSDYLQAEQQFVHSLVRVVNDLSKNSEACYFELLSRLERSIGGWEHKIAELVDSQNGARVATERQILKGIKEQMDNITRLIGDTRSSIQMQDSRVSTLEGITEGIERIISVLTSNDPGTTAVRGQTAASADNSLAIDSKPHHGAADFRYLLFENRFRGSEARIKERLRGYPALFTYSNYQGVSSAPTKPVLEIGAGRGELLELFSEQGIPAYGVELDSGMAALCRAKQLDVREEDGLIHLTTLEAGTLAGVIAVQVVEHLPLSSLKQLVQLCKRVVAPGGRVVFETINASSIVALTQHYFRDPTHQAPLHPDTLRHLLEQEGLRMVQLQLLTPFAEDALFRMIPTASYMTPRWIETVEIINGNLKKLNDLMYGYQDYCVIAEVPAEPAGSR